MSRATAALFHRVQTAPAYAAVHEQAVGLVGPAATGATWLDVGCGPGLVARLAAEQGYEVLGVDLDPAMIRAADRRGARSGLHFAVGALGADLPPADVVSAASLVCQLPDPAAGVAALWDLVRPGGVLLVVETTGQMSRRTVRAASAHHDRHSRLVLDRWAGARTGRAIPPSVFDVLPADHLVVPLLGGAVQARLATR